MIAFCNVIARDSVIGITAKLIGGAKPLVVKELTEGIIANLITDIKAFVFSDRVLGTTPNPIGGTKSEEVKAIKLGMTVTAPPPPTSMTGI